MPKKYLSVTKDSKGRDLFEYPDEFEIGKTYVSYYGKRRKK